ncbi:MAG: ABC transporter substrate binding protein [Mariprofundus sp.]|nr:ABC transporter substrate binding protein [Mariprofundus sp.]
MRLIVLLLFIVSISIPASAAGSKRCLYINSYHSGYAWSDGIEAAIKTELAGHCQLTIFRMDTKRNTSTAFGKQKALEAKKLIESLHPDVVIASDDNASKYLIAPYYKNSNLAIVFCGINWTAKAYGYPYNNATGMIEVSAIKALLHKAREILGSVHTVAFIAAKGVRTDEKEYAWMAKTYARSHVKVIPYYAANMAAWEQAYRAAQASDMIVLNNIAGIKNWHRDRAIAYAAKYAHKLTVSTYDFMAQYSMLAMTKIASEQGNWAAQVAIRLLQGKKANSIPVVANRRFNMFVNLPLLQNTDIKLPDSILFKAIKVVP